MFTAKGWTKSAASLTADTKAKNYCIASCYDTNNIRMELISTEKYPIRIYYLHIGNKPDKYERINQLCSFKHLRRLNVLKVHTAQAQ